MEIDHILPEGQRNKFADPEKHLRRFLQRYTHDIKRIKEEGINCAGQLILHTIRTFKLKHSRDQC